MTLTPLVRAVIPRVAILVVEKYRPEQRPCRECVVLAREARPEVFFYLDWDAGKRTEPGRGSPGIVLQIYLGSLHFCTCALPVAFPPFLSMREFLCV